MTIIKECICRHENIDHTGPRGCCMRIIGIKPCLCEGFKERKDGGSGNQDPGTGDPIPEKVTDHHLSGLIRMAADAAENDGGIDEIEEDILNRLADLLKGKSLEDVEQWVKSGSRRHHGL